MNTYRAAQIIWCGLLLGICLGWATSALAQADASHQVLIVAPDSPYPTIATALVAAEPGDTIEVHGGQHAAPVVIEKSVALVGVDNPVIDGQGSGSLVIITAPDTRFEGFTLRHSGDSVNHEDTGIVAQADNVIVVDNILEDVLFGIYFANADSGIARNNTVHCYDRELGLRGDGIRVWYSTNVLLDGNTVSLCRDTLIWYAENIIVENNYIHDSRYGLHVMYSSHATIQYNQFEGNSVGSYLMYSQHLTMTHNRMVSNRGPSGYGIAFKEMDYATVSDNLIVGNRAGIYIDNSPALVDVNNNITGNFLAYNDSGISALPDTARNIFESNTFLENLQQVTVLGRGNLLKNTWGTANGGNYWSDYVGYDGDGDGVGDTPYRAEKLFESLSDDNPVLRLFAFSPASQAIDFAASAFPSLRPDPKVIEEHPMMHYAPPVGLDDTARTVSLPFLAVSLALAGAGGGICLVALRGRFGRPARVKDVVQTSRAQA